MRITCASVVCLLAFVVAAALAAPYPCTYTSPNTNNKVHELSVALLGLEYLRRVSISMTCRTCGATVARARKTTRLPGMSTAPSSTCTRDVCFLQTFAQRLIVSRDSTLMLAQEHLWPDSRHQLQLPSSKWCVPSPANGWVWQWRCLQAHVRRLPYVCRSCACARPLSTSSLTSCVRQPATWMACKSRTQPAAVLPAQGTPSARAC